MPVHGHDVGARLTRSPQESGRCARLGPYSHGERLPDLPDIAALRKALSDWSFNVTASGRLPIDAADVPNEIAREVAEIARRSLPLGSFASPSTVRRAMKAISVKLDGTAAAAPTVAP